MERLIMISFNSEGIENLQALRAQICRIPLKLNGNALVQILNKAEMKKLEIASPNEGDSVMMSLFKPPRPDDDWNDDWDSDWN